MARLLKRATFEATNSHQLSIVIVPIIMVIIATLCVGLRFYSRRLSKNTTMFDDWLCLIALVLTWAFQGVNMAAVFAGGAGLPIATVLAIDPTALTTYLKIIYVNFTLWVVTVSVVQLSILFFYIRLFGVNKIFRWVAYVFVFLVSGFGIAGFFSQIFSCIPVTKSWDPMAPGTCVEGKPYCSAIGIIHVVLDFGIVFMPIPLIWQLQLARRSKMILSFLLLLGVITSVISLIKIVCIFDLTGIPQADITDYLWTTILLQTIELPIGIICCCVPSLKPVVVEVAPAFSSMRDRLLSYGRSSGSVSSSKVYESKDTTGLRSSGSGTGSTTKFTGNGGSFSNKAVAYAASDDVELDHRSEARGNNQVAVTKTYSVTRE